MTVHLADSLPKSAIERIDRSLSALPEGRRSVERRKRLHEWIDAGHGSCVLRHCAVAAMVQDTFLYFNGIRYRLHAWVVMPNHFHVLVEPIDGWALSKIVAAWKKFTARKVGEIANREIGVPGVIANREIGVPGNAGLPTGIGRRAPLWHREYWDRYMRNEEHYLQLVAYIHGNPVAAGLVEREEAWPWSSASKNRTGKEVS